MMELARSDDGKVWHTVAAHYNGRDARVLTLCELTLGTEYVGPLCISSDYLQAWSKNGEVRCADCLGKGTKDA